MKCPPEPPYLGKMIYPYFGYWLPLAITKIPNFRAFKGNLPKTTAPKYPLSLENWRIRIRFAYAFEWGRGGQKKTLGIQLSQINAK